MHAIADLSGNVTVLRTPVLRRPANAPPAPEVSGPRDPKKAAICSAPLAGQVLHGGYRMRAELRVVGVLAQQFRASRVAYAG